ncbi:MAG: hypothetical protein ACXW4O_17245 [Candidatus Binatia bacterium]
MIRLLAALLLAALAALLLLAALATLTTLLATLLLLAGLLVLLAALLLLAGLLVRLILVRLIHLIPLPLRERSRDGRLPASINVHSRINVPLRAELAIERSAQGERQCAALPRFHRPVNN